jgi:hypothetical protein
MMLAEPDLQHLLEQATAVVQPPADCGALLEGSIAEGFGNARSDVDFLLIPESDRHFPEPPTVMFVEGRRVEVRIRSTADVHRDFDSLVALRRRSPRRGEELPVDLLDRCQRLGGAVALANPDLVAQVRSTLPAEELKLMIVQLFSRLCLQHIRQAAAMVALSQTRDAMRWARSALTYGAKSWAAMHGETYIEPKWLSTQLERVNGDPTIVERHRALEAAPTLGGTPRQYLDSVTHFLASCGVIESSVDPAGATIGKLPGVTTWPIRGRLHVLRGRDDVFVLSDEAAAVWRRIVFGRPLTDLLGRVGGDAEQVGQLVTQFQRHGLIRFCWRGRQTISAVQVSTPSPGACRPVLSMDGAEGAEDRCPVTLLPVPASRFVAAGVALAWANVVVENAREDAEGAAAARQWAVWRAAMLRIVRQASLALLSAYGVHPLPAEEECCDRLRYVAGLPQSLARAALEIEDRIAFAQNHHDPVLATRLDAYVQDSRRLTGSSRFPSSFLDPEGWRDTLLCLYDWVRMAAYLDSAFPLAAVRDVLVTVQRQTRVGE